MDFEQYTISYDATHYEAFEKIEKNRKCFLIILRDDQVVGTLTDGDVRRAFLNGVSMEDSIEHTFNTDFEFLCQEDGLEEAILRFQKGNIKFLPVLGKDRELKNIITKEHLEWLSLQSKFVSMDYDFMSIDDLCSVREIHIRPWGFYKTCVINNLFQSKIININPQQSLSLQMHEKREEYWIVIHGTGDMTLDGSRKIVQAGSMLYIPRCCRHRIANLSQDDALIIAEVQLGDYFGEDDIIRFSDNYGRV